MDETKKICSSVMDSSYDCGVKVSHTQKKGEEMHDIDTDAEQ